MKNIWIAVVSPENNYIWFYLAKKDVNKGRFISKTFDNFNRLNHHWPKILPNLNSYFGKVLRIQIGENFRSVVVQMVEFVKGFRDKSTFK